MEQGNEHSYNNAKGKNSQMESHQIEKEARNEACSTCKGNKVMINWLQQSLKDLRNEMRMESSFQRENTTTQFHEIKELEIKYKKLQEAVKYYESNNNE